MLECLNDFGVEISKDERKERSEELRVCLEILLFY